MTSKRQLLEHLNRNELLAIVEECSLSVDDRRVVKQLVDAIAASRKVDLAAVLGGFTRDHLEELSRRLCIDDSSKENAAIIGRLLSRELAHEVPLNAHVDDTPKPTAARTVHTKLRTLVRRQLRKHGYPPDKTEGAVDTTPKQAELLAAEWAE